MKPIAERTCERAWLVAAEHLADLRDRTDHNLMIEILEPMVHEASDARIHTRVDAFLRRHKANPLTTVAGTIFPGSEYMSFGPRGVYEVYPDEVYPEIRSGSEWGRYAERLVRWPPSAPKSEAINPLKDLVDKMRKQLRGMKMRACYELSLTEPGLDLPLYDPVKDRRLPRTGPCLSHVSLKIGREKTLFLTALYRSHSYVERALGNFLGLAQLQAFVCDQTGLRPGPLVCVSTYARLETDGGWSVVEARSLVKSARSAYEEKQ